MESANSSASNDIVPQRSGLAVAAVMAAAICYSFVGIAYRLILDEFDVSPIAVVALRATTVAVVLLPLILLRPSLRAQLSLAAAPSNRWMLIAAGLVSSAGFYVALIYAFQLAGVAVGTVLLYLAPSMVAIATWFLFKERLTRGQLLALVLSFTGVVGVSGILSGGDSVRPLGIALGVIAAASYASYSLLGQKLLQQLNPLIVVGLTTALGAVGMWVAAIVVRGTAIPSLSALLWIVLATGLGTTLLPLVLYTWGLSKLGAARSTLLTTIEPAAAVLLAFVILDERLSPLQIGGGSLIVAGVLVVGLERFRR